MFRTSYYIIFTECKVQTLMFSEFSKYEFRVLGNMREHLERAKSDPQIRHT